MRRTCGSRAAIRAEQLNRQTGADSHHAGSIGPSFHLVPPRASTVRLKTHRECFSYQGFIPDSGMPTEWLILPLSFGEVKNWATLNHVLQRVLASPLS